jgi:NitT/TauT family transport system permease protein
MATLQQSLDAALRWRLHAAGLIGFVVVWWAIAASGLIPRAFMPGPGDVALQFIKLTQDPFAGHTLQTHLTSSVGRYLLGFGLAVAVGLPLGLLMGWFRILDAIVTPLFEALRYIAPIAWVPFAALWFGTGIGGPTLIIFAGAFPPCVVNAYRGARQVEPVLIEAARMLGLSSLRMITQVLLPAAVPSIIAGVRVSAGLGWQSLVGAELIVASSGVGYLMVKGQSSVATAIVMSGMIAIGLVGLLIDIAIRRVEASVQKNRGRQA